MLNIFDFVRIFKLLHLKLETKIEKFFLEFAELSIKLLDSQFSKFFCIHYA